MRRAGKVVAEMHEAIRAALRPGVTTLDLDRVGREVLERRGATSNFLGYHGYPAVICASPNDVVIHGIPGPTRLDEGDLVSVDCGAIVEGWHGDAAFTAGVGVIDTESRRLIDVSEAALAAAIAQMRPGRRLSDVSHAVGAVVEAAGLETIEGYGGHGIGRRMHEAPDVPNSARPGRGPVLGPGVVLAIEPMVVAGRPGIRHLDDGWSVVTADGRRAAHVEHTVAVTEDGPEILTRAE
jgi:methionyl aminopeptidase